MKWIKYKLRAEVNQGTEEEPQIEEVFTEKAVSYCETNLAIAEKEAWNGEYTIEDDGEEEETEATTDEVLNVLLGVTE